MHLCWQEASGTANRPIQGKHYNKPTCQHAVEILGYEEIQDLSEEPEAVLHVSLDQEGDNKLTAT
jgi:hypothetical protein